MTGTPNAPASLATRLEEAKRILRAILEAEERGQGVQFAEAMGAAAAFLLREGP